MSKPALPQQPNVALANALRAKGQQLGQKPMQQVLAGIPSDYIPNQPAGTTPGK